MVLKVLGLVVVLTLIWYYFVRKPLLRRPTYTVLLWVRNRDHDIEQIVRDVLLADPDQLVIVDDHSADETPYILEILCKRYPGLQTVAVTGELDPLSVGVFLCNTEITMLLQLQHDQKWQGFVSPYIARSSM